MAVKEHGLPNGFDKEEWHIEREELSGIMFIRNSKGQMIRMRDGVLEIYYQCDKCYEEGFKDTFKHHSRCKSLTEGG